MFFLSTNSTTQDFTAEAPPPPEIPIRVIIIEETVFSSLDLPDSETVHPIWTREAALNRMYFEKKDLVVFTDCTVKSGDNLLDVLKFLVLPNLNATRAIDGKPEVVINASALDFLSLPSNQWSNLEYVDISMLPVSKVFTKRFVVLKSNKPCK